MRRLVIALLLAICLTVALAAPALAAPPPQAEDGLKIATAAAEGTPAEEVLDGLLGAP